MHITQFHQAQEVSGNIFLNNFEIFQGMDIVSAINSLNNTIHIGATSVNLYLHIMKFQYWTYTFKKWTQYIHLTSVSQMVETHKENISIIEIGSTKSFVNTT